MRRTVGYLLVPGQRSWSDRRIPTTAHQQSLVINLSTSVAEILNVFDHYGYHSYHTTMSSCRRGRCGSSRCNIPCCTVVVINRRLRHHGRASSPVTPFLFFGDGSDDVAMICW